MTAEYEEAKRLFSGGDKDKAWEVARKDERLKEGATRAAWEEHMSDVLRLERAHATRRSPKLSALSGNNGPPPPPPGDGG